MYVPTGIRTYVPLTSLIPYYNAIYKNEAREREDLAETHAFSHTQWPRYI